MPMGLTDVETQSGYYRIGRNNSVDMFKAKHNSRIYGVSLDPKKPNHSIPILIDDGKLKL
jgi:hypothetical protein